MVGVIGSPAAFRFCGARPFSGFGFRNDSVKRCAIGCPRESHDAFVGIRQPLRFTAVKGQQPQLRWGLSFVTRILFGIACPSCQKRQPFTVGRKAGLRDRFIAKGPLAEHALFGAPQPKVRQRHARVPVRFCDDRSNRCPVKANGDFRRHPQAHQMPRRPTHRCLSPAF
ncbi:hypothetical protein HRbin17_02819 [bacterium HR17]|uniref:Uncharacterized protein n=1 Tax=Candidatus Fervidibacter japonicus TaxID=2035412 RepID=A0A2H5XGH3_9BACT|nr:hypothetical protein HRbin17_02819 [bacterium HR17]